MSIILFSGVHGVGKNHFLSIHCQKEKTVTVYTASEIIGQYTNSEDAGYKRVNNVDSNQLYLLDGLKKVDLNKTIFLNGHLCLLNREGEIERIPEEFFAEANIHAIIILQDDPIVIQNRLNKRDGRSNVDEEILEKMQEAETDYARELNMKYGIKNYVIHHNIDDEEWERLYSEVILNG